MAKELCFWVGACYRDREERVRNLYRGTARLGDSSEVSRDLQTISSFHRATSSGLIWEALHQAEAVAYICQNTGESL
jgi:hypothetical protein